MKMAMAGRKGRNAATTTKTLIPFICMFGFANGLGGGGHHIRLIIMLALGLAGLFMLHMLAQDFNKIHGALTNAGKLFTIRAKRHDGTAQLGDMTLDDNITLPEINWAKILSRDPTGCARSLVCQLATIPENRRAQEESNILTIVEVTTTYTKNNWASQQMRNAFKLGLQSGKQQICYEKYTLCPYSSSTMLALLRIFGGTKTK